MNYNEFIKSIQEKVKNGEPVHGWMLDMLIDYQLNNKKED